MLTITQGRPTSAAPRVAICGHFHGNVERVESMAFGAPLEVVTTSAVGCPMLWNGTSTNRYTPQQATAIGAEPTVHLMHQRRVRLRSTLMMARPPPPRSARRRRSCPASALSIDPTSQPWEPWAPDLSSSDSPALGGLRCRMQPFCLS